MATRLPEEEWAAKFPKKIRTVDGSLFVGPHSYSEFMRFHKEDFWTTYRDYNSQTLKVTPQEEVAKACFNDWGPVPWKRANKLSFKTFVADVLPEYTWEFVRHSGKSWWMIDKIKLELAQVNLENIQQCYRDNQINLIPVVMFFGETPSEIRSQVGRAAWRKLCANSKTKNKHLFSNTSSTWETIEPFLDLRKLPIPASFSSTLRDLDAYLHAAKVTPTVKQFQRTLHIAYDTKRMLSQLDTEYNTNWSFKRLKEEHDKASKELLARSHSPVPFAEERQEEIDGYTFTKLVSRLSIVLEGKEMRHCVGGYSSYAAKGNYQVWKIEGPERGTLGVSFDSKLRSPWVFQQAYGQCNSYLTDKARAACYKLVEKLNKVGEVYDTE